MPKEIWKPIAGYEIYQISSRGRVRRVEGKGLRPGHIKVEHTFRGYPRQSLWNRQANTSKTYSVHRLVALAFLPKPVGKKEVDHINGIRTDNRVENLRWVTHRQNIEGAMDRAGWTVKARGVLSPNSRLTEKQVRIIHACVRIGAPRNGWMRELARAWEVSPSCIAYVVHGRGWRHLPTAPKTKYIKRVGAVEVNPIKERALSPNRDAVLGAVDGQSSVVEIGIKSGVSRTLTGKYLKEFAENGIVKRTTKGQRGFYAKVLREDGYGHGWRKTA